MFLAEQFPPLCSYTMAQSNPICLIFRQSRRYNRRNFPYHALVSFFFLKHTHTKKSILIRLKYWDWIEPVGTCNANVSLLWLFVLSVTCLYCVHDKLGRKGMER